MPGIVESRRVQTDVVIAGAGIVGLALARELAGRGVAVRVVDRGDPGSGATRAAAGILSPTDPHEWEDVLGAFNADSIELWRTWERELGDETGLPTGYEPRGEVWVGPPGEPIVTAALRGAARVGWRAQELDAAAIRALEPGVVADGLQGVHLPDTAAVHTGLVTDALLASCRARGVELVAGTITGLRDGALTLAAGGAVPYATLVVATGAWTDAWLPEDLRPGLIPRLGESLLVRSPGAVLCARPVRSAAGSIVPRSDGTYWVGVTMLERGFQEHPSAGSVRRIIERTSALIPALDEALFIEARSGLRPASPTGLPIVGPARDGIVFATGHGREGIIQAPLTARLLADGLADGDWSATPTEFLPAVSSER
jgi:glycine oxidase